MQANSVGNTSMPEPIAYFITCVCYGTWLPGDQRGWVEYHQGWQLPVPNLEQLCRSSMTEGQCVLGDQERLIVIRQIEETCRFRGWKLYAVDCRSNHFHAVVGASNADPVKIRKDLKSWCTRRLKESSKATRQNWWAERGSVRWIRDEGSLDTVVEYVNFAQDRKGRDAVIRRANESS